ncbi:DNA cytosine methyltransferase [Clostridium paraputrificum]|uniref:DNA cytosine methyltransferase n=1 Tax=Clostridium paraputrificum TaxID=29363 RepID=UPI00232F2419|nr:DNA cytosine methyltransferase [Clostridium paraputrificum]MDB2091113.1 DNA cytosine methyltransferase [Clostridium paraputrificum]MDB2097869.1 DNA cytosine methyltransferase [Clostridium paraputrificum]
MNKNYKVVSLFSGAGGMDLGFIKAGFKVIWANDFFKEATDTYKLNIGEHIVHGDITQIDSSEIPDNPDIVIGGFPCQGFSVANTKRSMEDKRNFLYKEMLRVIGDKKPKFFVAENVKGILSIEKGKVFEMIKSDFENLGYKVDYKLLNAAEYGVPQNRERVIIMGNRVGLENIFPEKTHYINDPIEGLEPAKTVAETIGFLSDIRISQFPINFNDKIIYNHDAATNVSDKFWGRMYEVNQADICDYLKEWRNKSGWTTKKVDEHFGYAHTAGHWFRKDNKSGSIPKPDDWWELKKILKFDNKYDKEVTTLVEKEIKYEQSLRITNWDRPSDTITATSPEIHINKMRRLSVRECAMIQTFPDDFVFTGSLNRMYTQVGNAVPVLLAEKIAKKIIEQLKMLND